MILLVLVLGLRVLCGLLLYALFYSLGWRTDTAAFVAGSAGSFIGQAVLEVVDRLT